MRPFLAWTIVLAAAAALLAFDAIAGLLGAAQACFFQVAPCPGPGGALAVQLDVALLGLPLVWVLGIAIGGAVWALIDRRRSSMPASGGSHARGTPRVGASLALIGRATLVVLAVATLALLVLALARAVDPGPPTFDAVATLVGVGVALAALVLWARSGPEATLALRLGCAAAFVGGSLMGYLWLSLRGGTFLLSDRNRIVAQVVADVAIAGWLIVVAWSPSRLRVPFGGGLASLLALRAAVEIWLTWATFTGPDPSGGPSSPTAALLIAGLVLLGWVALAGWELVLGIAPADPSPT